MARELGIRGNFSVRFVREHAARGFSAVIAIDADGQHETEDVRHVLAPVQVRHGGVINADSLFDFPDRRLRGPSHPWNTAEIPQERQRRHSGGPADTAATKKRD